MKRTELIGLSLVTSLVMGGCASKRAMTEVVAPSSPPLVESQEVLTFSQRIESSIPTSTPVVTEEVEEIPVKVTSPVVAPIKVSRAPSFGKAGWYGRGSQGEMTANGELFDGHALTAAHRTLPFDSMVRVTDMVTNKSTVVRINDRGPSVQDRIIDLSHAAAKRLGLLRRGSTDVRLEVLSLGEGGVFSEENGQDCDDGKCVASFGNTPQEISSVERPASGAIPFRPRGYIANQQDLLDISSKISVQVGAFRKHAGAKVYAKRYSLLTDQYHVQIKKGFKDGAPLYRVQLQGFDNEHEARAFIREYGIDGAFLVRR